MLDKLLKGEKAAEDCAPGESMKGNPKLKAKRELLEGVRKMAMRLMKEQGDKPDHVEATVALVEPEAQMEALKSGEEMEFENSPKGLGNESPTELSMTEEHEQSPEALKARIKELEAKLAAKA